MLQLGRLVQNFLLTLAGRVAAQTQGHLLALGYLGALRLGGHHQMVAGGDDGFLPHQEALGPGTLGGGVENRLGRLHPLTAGAHQTV